MTLGILFLCILGLSDRAAAYTSVQPRGVSNTSKAGLAWPNGNYNDYRQYTTTGKVSWYYTWSPNPINANLEFVPQLWGTTQVDAFSSNINNTISKNDITAVLGFNEPEQSGQSNLSVEEGAELWKTYIEPLKGLGIRLGTPATSSAPSGKAWIQDWLSACGGGCNPDFVVLHWYDVNATQFQLYLEDFHNTFQLPIWVTEWACQNFNGGAQCSEGGVIAFLNQTQAFMDATDWVERYAWYGVMEKVNINEDNAMMSSSGKITSLGEQYIGAITADENGGGDGPSVGSAARGLHISDFSTSSLLAGMTTLVATTLMLLELIFLTTCQCIENSTD